MKKKKIFRYMINFFIVALLVIGVNSCLFLNTFGYQDPAISEQNYNYKASDSDLMRLSRDKIEGLWLPAEPPAYESKGIPVDDPEAMVSKIGEYIPSEFQKFEGLRLSYTAPNEGLFIKYLKQDQSKTVFPPDDRVNDLDTTVYPWRTIVKLWITFPDGGQFMGSGAIIDDFHVLTCGHCVYSIAHGGWADIEVVPGLDGTYKPFYSAWDTNIRSYIEWTQNENRDHDWAVITLDRNIGAWTGWMGRGFYYDLNWYSGEWFHTAGYPGDLSYNGRVMYYAGDYADYATEYILCGQSGWSNVEDIVVGVDPVVTTQAATNLLTISVTANGTITSDGGSNITERGFEYGLTQTPPWSVKETGTDLGIGAFSQNISGLTEGTTYYIRAYAKNNSGTGYGSWLSFTSGTSGINIPTLDDPGTSVSSGASYSVIWSDESGSGATKYTLQEDILSDFSSAQNYVLTETSKTFGRIVDSDTTFYYRAWYCISLFYSVVMRQYQQHLLQLIRLIL